jgi:hypothetical protein
MPDWADKLAREIAKDLGADDRQWSSALRLQVVAAKLRLVQHNGIGIGVDRAKDAIKPKDQTNDER